jgi:hypothetical protein
LVAAKKYAAPKHWAALMSDQTSILHEMLGIQWNYLNNHQLQAWMKGWANDSRHPGERGKSERRQNWVLAASLSVHRIT